MSAGRIVAACFIVGLLGGLAAGASREIALGVPEGAIVFGHWTRNPERDYLTPYYEEVWKAFEQSGFIEEAVRLATAALRPAERDAFAAQWKGWEEILRKVDWEAFLSHEIAIGLSAETLPGMPIPAMLPRVIVRMDGDRLGRNMEVLASIFSKLAGLGPDVAEAVSAEELGATWAILRMKEPPLPFGLFAAAQDGVLVFGFRKDLVEESLRLVRGETRVGAEGEAGPLLRSERFAKAFAGLPAPEDGRSYLDVRAFLGIYRQVIDVIGLQAAQNPRLGSYIPAAKKLVDAFDVAESVASVQTTEGQRLHTFTAIRMREGWESGPFYKVVANRVLPDGFHRWIPASATSFSSRAGIDLLALYGEATAFVEKEIPNGGRLLERWGKIQERIGFRPAEDLFSWIEGTVVQFGVPSAAPNPLGMSEDGVFVLGVRDVEEARRKLDAWIARLLARFPPDRALLQVNDAPGLEGFKTVAFVPLPFLAPTFGFWKEEGGSGGALVIGTSDAGVKLALAARKGEAKDLREHPFVKEMGGMPVGIVTAVSYSDLARSFGGLAQMCGMVNMFAAFIPDDRPEAKLVKQILSLAPRLAPVLYKLRFLQTSAAISTYDPATRTLKQRAVVRTAPPKKAEAEPAPKKESTL